MFKIFNRSKESDVVKVLGETITDEKLKEIYDRCISFGEELKSKGVDIYHTITIEEYNRDSKMASSESIVVRGYLKDSGGINVQVQLRRSITRFSAILSYRYPLKRVDGLLKDFKDINAHFSYHPYYEYCNWIGCSDSFNSVEEFEKKVERIKELEIFLNKTFNYIEGEAE